VMFNNTNRIGGVLVSVLASSAVDRGIIDGVLVSVLASSAVDRGIEPRSGQTKDDNIGICCFSAKYTALRRK
jgi:coenzyme F420-reducing hydrogenase beta subunit